MRIKAPIIASAIPRYRANFISVLYQLFKQGGVQRMLAPALNGNLAGADEVCERAVHINHTLFRTGLNDAVNLMRSSFADKVRHRLVVDEEFKRLNKPPGNTLNKALGKNREERPGKLDANLLLLLRRERVNDAVNGLR